MRLRRIIPGLICVLFVTSFAFASKIRVDYDHTANFSKYRTFSWVEKPQSENPLMDERIVRYITAQLCAKGLKQVASGGDLNISAATSVEEKQILNTWYSNDGWGWGWAGSGYATTYVETYLVGTTEVNLIDNACDKLVWHGTSVGTISSKPEKASKKNAERIAEMFEKYPPSYARISG